MTTVIDKGNDHAPLVRSSDVMYCITGCICGWKAPPGVDSDVAYAYHTAITRVFQDGMLIAERKIVHVLDALDEGRRVKLLARINAYYAPKETPP